LPKVYDGEADDRKSHNATGRTKKHDVRGLTFDDLDELDGISATANPVSFFSFVP
jgi:hypothetical protein